MGMMYEKPKKRSKKKKRDDALKKLGVETDETPKIKYCKCPFCPTVGHHYWHHIFNGTNKIKQEIYDAVIYPCWECHVTNKDSIHNDADRRKALKRQHQERIMREEGWSIKEFKEMFGKNYLEGEEK